jgi:hypothetical protein
MKKYFNILFLLIVVNIIMANSTVKPFEKIPLSTPTAIEQFMEKIAKLESNGNHTVVNQYGMLGRYQFSPSTIKVLGFNYTKEQFLSNRFTQDTVMLTYMEINERELAPLINRFEGRIIKGVRITRASVLAGAHFAGSRNMRTFLTDPNNSGISDGNGTTLIKYMSHFQDFHLPPIKI